MNAPDLSQAFSDALDADDTETIETLIASHPRSAPALRALREEHRMAQVASENFEARGWFPITKVTTYTQYKASTIRQLAREGVLGRSHIAREPHWPFRLFLSPTAVGFLASRQYQSSGPRKPEPET